ncbi:putative membrane protein [Methanococcus voltae]|uniref:Membrane protein n=1 Tax=Methanococcus voltae PS TaxID=523842 RepID=A0ABT2EXA5_METVO|nr:hypothetical protein [Methanococcus voltae]MBP2143843.1 putative membrane protein [Methanococcus voltae]MCS3922594.1 putative membrane protein [Methanococcus voltae PS]
MIQQIIAIILALLVTLAYNEPISTIGNILGFSELLAWATPTVLILLCVWKLASSDWGLGDAISLIVLATLSMLYITQNIDSILLEVSKLMLGVGTGVVIGYLAKGGK